MLEPEFRFVDDSEAVEECREFGEAGNHVRPVRRVRLGDLEPVGDAEVLEDGRVEAERDDLGDAIKQRLFSLNAARLYDLEVPA